MRTYWHRRCTSGKQDRHCTYDVTLGACAQPLLPRRRNNYQNYEWLSVLLPYLSFRQIEFFSAPHWNVACGLSGSTRFFPHYLTNGTIFEGGKKIPELIESKMCVLIFSTTFCLNDFSLQGELSEILLKMYIGLHVKYSLLLSDFNETSIFWTYFRKKSQIKFHENTTSWSRVAPYGRREGQTDMTKLRVASRNFASALKNI